MDKESFNHLLEVQSCSRKIDELEQKVMDEKKRVDFVRRNVQSKLDDLNDLEEKFIKAKSHAKQLEHEAAKIHEQIERTQNHLNSAVNQNQADAAQKEITILSKKIEDTEKTIFITWEKLEEYELEINETKSFKEGSKNSLNNLENEVDMICNDLNNEIQRYTNRKNEILAELPSDISQTFKTIENHKKPAVTFMDNKRCTSCRTALDQVLIEEINSSRKICHCSTCGRILVSPDLRY